MNDVKTLKVCFCSNLYMSPKKQLSNLFWVWLTLKENQEGETSKDFYCTYQVP